MAVQKKEHFKLISTASYDEFCTVVAKQIENQIKTKVDSRLALPAGNSPRGYYNLLAQSSKNNAIDWREVTCFALDDYLDVDELYSFQTFFQEHLFRFTNIENNATFNPRFFDNYDQLIADKGGIDLCLLGLGVNGHIAFNEPPTMPTSWTHCVFLTRSTREANKNAFISDSFGSSPIPTRAVTMGIATILASKQIILAVSGAHKKETLKRALYDLPSPLCPASYLTAHPDLLVITDFAFEGLA